MREKLSGGSGVGVLGRLHCEGVTGGRRSIWQVEDGGAAFQGEGTAGQRPGSREQHRLLENDVGARAGLGETTRKAEGQVCQTAASFSRRRLVCTLKHWSES